MENKNAFDGFIGPTNTMRSQRYDAQRTVNMYLELDISPYAKENERACFIGTPGLQLIQQVGNGPIRALYIPSNQQNLLIIVSGANVYTVTNTFTISSTVNLIGTLQTNSGPVSIADNGIQTFLVDGQFGYYITTLSPFSVTQVSDPHFFPSSKVTFQDGYFIFNQVGSEDFFLSNVYAPTFYPLNETNKSGFADNLITAISNNRELYLFGSQTTEIWWNSGASGSTPFQRQDGKFINFGCAASASAVKLDNTIFWLGGGQGNGIVFMLQGDQAVRISNNAIEFLIAQSSNLAGSTAYGYQEEGHFFYVLNIPGLATTLVYDASTQLWHERQSFNSSTQLQGRHWGDNHVLLNGMHIIGDFQNGNVYQASLSFYSDNGTPQFRMRQSPHVSKNLNRLFYKLLEIDFQFGVGLNGFTNIDGDGTNPQVILQISNDGGQTWGNEVPAQLGKIGQFFTRARWQRLGSSRDRVFRVYVTDPVAVMMLSARLDVEVGTA